MKRLVARLNRQVRCAKTQIGKEAIRKDSGHGRENLEGRELGKRAPEEGKQATSSVQGAVLYCIVLRVVASLPVDPDVQMP
jgi:hypothetical protein